MAALSIGATAAETGVKVPTIRYYERIGLLPAPPRTGSNRRQYDRGDVKRLKFIRHARDMGFEIEAIRQLLDLAAHPGQHCHDADDIARRHLLEVNRRIEQLTALRSELARMIESCQGGTIGACRIMEILSDHSLCGHERH